MMKHFAWVDVPRDLSQGPPATERHNPAPSPASDPAPDLALSVQTAAFLQDLVLDSTDVDHFLDKLARVAATHLSRLDHEVLCGVTLLRPRHAKTLASSSPYALELDRIQYLFGDGPCLRAARTGEIVLVRDTRTDERWPQYVKAIADHRIRSTLGVPIPLEGEADCALNFYSTTVNGFTPEAVEAAKVFARDTSKSLRLAVRIAQLSDKAENLNAALESRTIIDLAAGIVMGQNRCSQSAAIEIMKTAANHRQIKLRRLATEIVSSISDDTPATHFD
ncbi:GAF and ANTAR domain-containing protein [Arthrobacter agilis]|uniref:GAF and ANTAR domain-containing protein n=1 Tax=Arthrobacter agilis TaxID=37921 RepID=UPI0027803B50|nr:GAF and ANTAR domain-containing protein [Arthrobacter agilis]MDQ0734717.1 putative methionine-R-sulfoxide reductase with GAF domain [Arthrobacter agilis]